MPRLGPRTQRRPELDPRGLPARADRAGDAARGNSLLRIASASSGALPQSLLELRSEAAADGHALSVGEDENGLAVEERLDLPDPVDVDDRSSVNPQENAGIQSRLQLVHRLADQSRDLSGMDVDVVARRLDPVDVPHAEDLDAPVGFDEQARRRSLPGLGSLE